MRRSINAWFFDASTSPAEMAHQCAAAGFEALELTLAEDGSITPQTDEARFEKQGFRSLHWPPGSSGNSTMVPTIPLFA
jgi:hypothetical protein